MIYNEKHVVTGPVVVLWDGITRPEVKDEATIHSIKVAIPTTAPEVSELRQLVSASQIEAKLPASAGVPILTMDATKYPEVAGPHFTMNCKTRQGAPQIYGIGGEELTSMIYGSKLYPGVLVKLLVHTYPYDAAGNRGVAFGLDGIMIVDATTPQLSVATAIDSSAAFGITPEPAKDFLMPPPPSESAGPTMTAKAGGMTREQFVDVGWNDEQLITQGYMTR